MTISVVMAAYNAEAYISEAIQSVLAQSTPDWELIVVDDMARDGTATIVETYASDPRIRLIRRAHNGGPAQARRDGTLAARYNYVSYLDADDRLRPTTLEVLRRALQGRPEAVLAYGDFVRIDAKGKPFGLHRFLNGQRRRPSGDVLADLLRNNHMPNGGCALIRRKYLIESDCWNTQLVCAEDWVAWAILATYGPFVHVPGLKALEYRELITGLSQVWNIHYDKALPSIDAVFRDHRVLARVPAARLTRLRARREANMWLYLASLNIRRGRWAASLKCLGQAIRRDPTYSPRLAAKYAMTSVDRFL